jgi:tetratricopeptide (TPR) repeat protein
MSSTLVKRWIELSAAITREESAAIPLIDEHQVSLDLDDEFHQVWRYGDNKLHTDFVAALLENPADLASRFACLNAYYLLMEYKRGLEEDDILGTLTKQREAYRRKLELFVGRPVESCIDLRTIRWEIVNSFAAGDNDRAFKLCDQLRPLLPSWQASFFRGRLRFLAVHLPLWDDRPSLSSWDIPVGPAPTDWAAIMRPLGALAIVTRLFRSPELLSKISPDAKAHLRTAIVDFETALDEHSSISPDCRLMLAWSYAAVGRNHEAAQSFRWLLSHRDLLQSYYAELFEPIQLPTEDRLSVPLSALFQRLVTAHQRAEEIDEAITTAQEWIVEFPQAADAYPLLARLHEEKGDLKAALGWYRKGEECIPGFGDDWKTSLILKLDETTSAASIDRTIETYRADHPIEIDLISFALGHHWSEFKSLDEESKQRWSTGIHILSTGVLPGFAVHAFSGVTERALRESIFIPFREEVRRNPALVGDISNPADDAKPFCNFLSGKADPAFGQMLTIAMISAKSSHSPFGPFAKWLHATHPKYFQKLGQLRDQPHLKVVLSISKFDHHWLARTDADKMLDATKQMISLVYELPPVVNSI